MHWARHSVRGAEGDAWHFLDLTYQAQEIPVCEANTLIHTASLWLLPGWIERFHARGVRRLMAFSSTIAGRHDVQRVGHHEALG
jgi:hypothetical protein